MKVRRRVGAENVIEIVFHKTLFWYVLSYDQGRREPNVGPGPAQM